jgi:TDG/mug DNA glycosylase family protein
MGSHHPAKKRPVKKPLIPRVTAAVTVRPTREQLRAAYGKTIRDLIAPDLRVLFIGINPSLYSAAVGHHFARPGNRFWPTLYGAGFTDRLLAPAEERLLLDRGYGITNLVDGATAQAAELTEKDLSTGVRRLEKKVARFRPRWVAFLGISTYQAAWDRSATSVGPQQSRFGGARVWLLPNPSGLNAHYQLPALVRLFGDLRLQTTRAARRTGPAEANGKLPISNKNARR